MDIPKHERNTILVIERGKRYRRLLEHDELVRSLRHYFGVTYEVKEFGPSMFTKPLTDHIQMFSGAAVVVGPHGAGFANIVFCAEDTGVIEIGFDGSDGMSYQKTNYRWAYTTDIGLC